MEKELQIMFAFLTKYDRIIPIKGNEIARDGIQMIKL